MKNLLLAIFMVLLVCDAGAAAPDEIKSPPPTNLTGTWDAAVVIAQGAGTPVFTFEQNGEKLTGRYRGQLGEAVLTGTVRGKEFAFTYTLRYEEELTVEYAGVVESDRTIKGKVKFGQYAAGTFNARRRD